MKRVVGAAIVVAVLAEGTASAQSGSTARNGPRIEVAVTRYMVNAKGEPLGAPAQTVRYRLTRVLTAAGWTTVMTMAAPEGATAQEVRINPFFGGRVEFDASGSITMFDNQGRQVPVPPGLHLPPLALMGDDWPSALNGVRTDAASRRARLEDVESRYTKQAGKVRGLTQYLRRNGEDAEELLVDEALGLPVELNVVHGSRLKGHLAFDYVQGAERTIRRGGTRSEFVLNDEGDRAITVTRFSDLRDGEEQ